MTTWTKKEYRLARASWKAADVGGLNYFLAVLGATPDDDKALRLLEPSCGSLAELRLLADMVKPRIVVDWGEDEEEGTE